MREIKFFNEFHLGDGLFHTHYCNKLIEKNDCRIIFYCKKEYHNELESWINDPDKIILDDINNKTSDSVNCWLNSLGHYNNRLNYNLLYDKIYLDFYNDLSKLIKLENPIKTTEEFLFNEKQIIKTKNILGNFDFLIVNSQGLSGQWNDSNFDPLFKKLLNKKYKLITTAKNNFRIPSTLDYHFSLLEISNLSLSCKNIIGVDTAPLVSTLNIWNINNNKNFIIFQNIGHKYSFKSENIKSLNEILKLDL